MAHTLYGARGRMRDDDVQYATGTQPGPTPSQTNRSSVPPLKTQPLNPRSRFTPPSSMEQQEGAAAPARPQGTYEHPNVGTYVNHAQFAPAPQRSDSAALQAQLRLCEHEIYTLRERLRLANEAMEQKDVCISSLQARLSGVPNTELREWCGGPCKGTQPLGSKTKPKDGDGKRQRRKRSTNCQTDQSKPDTATAFNGLQSERSQRSDGDLEKQLDQAIAECQDRDGLSGADPDVAAWKQTNSLSGDPTSRFVVPDLPGASATGDNFSEEGAMADLDREIRSALQLEDYESHSRNMDLIQALDVDGGYAFDSD